MHALSLLTDPNAWAALVTLTVLEIVLGIDNLVFISVLTSRLDEASARRARQIGLSLAFIFRVIMLTGGGLFLIAKATHEIHAAVEAHDDDGDVGVAAAAQAFAWIVVQLVV